MKTTNKIKHLKTFAIINYVGAAINSAAGMFKLLVYENSAHQMINAYVQGDAYNYIINANYAIAFFILSFTSIFIGTAALFYRFLLLRTSNETE